MSKQADSHTLPAATLITNMKDKHKEDMETIKEAYDECPSIAMRLESLQDRIDRMDRAMSRISNIERRLAFFFLDLNNKVYEQEIKLKEI